MARLVAKRRFYLRPGYLARHFGDALRIVSTKPAIVSRLLSRVLFGQPVVHATVPPGRHQPAHQPQA